MPVITINGPIGSGAVGIGQMVSQRLELNFIDRLVYSHAARLVGQPVGALIDKEQRSVRFRDKLGRFLQNMLERSAMSGLGGEPYFGRGVDYLPPETYMNPTSGSLATAVKVDDKVFIEALSTVVKDLCHKGDVVIIGRSANIILADTPDVIHVGLLAPMELRVQTVMQVEHLDRADAEVYVEELERARVAFVSKFFQTHPNEPTLYHMMLNMDKIKPRTAAEVIVHAAGDLAS